MDDLMLGRLRELVDPNQGVVLYVRKLIGEAELYAGAVCEMPNMWDDTAVRFVKTGEEDVGEGDCSVLLIEIEHG